VRDMDSSNLRATISARLLPFCLSLFAGCSSPAPPDQGASAINQRDASGDGSRGIGSGGSGGTTHDASTHDGGLDASTHDGGLQCLENVAEACARMPTLRCHWDVATFCASIPRPTSMTICDEYRGVLYRDADITGTDFYDAMTGDLVAMIAHYYIVGEGVRCNAGPPNYFLPGKCTNGRNFYCPDAGGSVEAGKD
jgi:hypothetical protein